MKNLKYYLEKAKKEGWAMGQFNFSEFVQMKAIVATAEKMKSPVILGTSEGESRFFGLQEAIALRNVLRSKTGLPIFLNLDHGRSFDYLKQAIDAGYDMVHFDGSKLSLQENIKITKQVVEYARRGRQKKVLVEGEVGRIGTDSSKLYSEKFEVKEKDLTDLDDAQKFIKETGADLLAVSVGNFHGIEISGTYPDLRLDLLKKIRERINGVSLVLHGGSGISEGSIKEAMDLGIVKININTELRLALSNSIRESLKNPEEIVPYVFLQPAKEAVEKVVEQKIKLFDSLNKI